METSAQPIEMPLRWFEIWRIALLHPTIKAFSRLAGDPKASTKRGILWMCVASLTAWVVGPQRPILSGLVASEVGLKAIPIFVLIGAVAAPVIGVTTLLVGAAVSHGLARLLEGKGTYDQLVYSWAAILLPFVLLSGLAMYFPALFPTSRAFILSRVGIAIRISSLIMILAAYLYLSYAEVVAFSAVERFSLGKGLAVLVLQAIVVGFAMACVYSGFQWLMMSVTDLL